MLKSKAKLNWGFVFVVFVFCHIHTHTTSNIVDENGDPHFEKINTHISKLDEEIRDIAQNTFTLCQNPQGNDKCERAFSIHKCWKTTDPKVITSLCFIFFYWYWTFTNLIFVYFSFEKCYAFILSEILALLHRLNGSI